MAYEGGEYSQVDIFDEVKEAAVRERIISLVQYRDLIDEIVEEKRIYGFFSDDDDTSQIKKDLEARWSEVEESLAKNQEIEIP
jgi:hypothetical protein